MRDERDSQTLAGSARQAKRAVLNLAAVLVDTAANDALGLTEALKQIGEKLKKTLG